MPRIDFWSTEFRVANRCPTNRNNTNNLVETSFRYTKDIQLNRLKAYNFTGLLRLILDDSEFYQTKAVDAANNRIETWLKSTNSKYIFDASVIDETKIQKLSQTTFMVNSETKADVSYLVDMETRDCSFPLGLNKGPCKHKYWVSVTQVT